MKSIPKISLLVLGLLSVIIGILFYIGGNSGSIDSGGESIDVPTYTNTLLYWTYILVFLSIVITIGILAVQFVIKLKDDAKSGLKSLIGIIAIVALIVISFLLGSSETIEITGYEGTDNSGFWAQFSDMCIFSMYVLLFGAFISIFAVSLYKQIKK